MITVHSDNILIFGPKHYPCALGRGGIVSAENKSEGDGATPAGRFALREIYYRADRLSLPPSALRTTALTDRDGWSDDPLDPSYNTKVALPHGAHHEVLWRADPLYDILVVLGYNDDPSVPGKGSAIFFHLAHDDLRPTQGCVAIALGHMLEILAKITRDEHMELSLAPSSTLSPGAHQK